MSRRKSPNWKCALAGAVLVLSEGAFAQTAAHPEYACEDLCSCNLTGVDQDSQLLFHSATEESPDPGLTLPAHLPGAILWKGQAVFPAPEDFHCVLQKKGVGADAEAPVTLKGPYEISKIRAGFTCAETVALNRYSLTISLKSNPDIDEIQCPDVDRGDVKGVFGKLVSVIPPADVEGDCGTDDILGNGASGTGARIKDCARFRDSKVSVWNAQRVNDGDQASGTVTWTRVARQKDPAGNYHEAWQDGHTGLLWGSSHPELYTFEKAVKLDKKGDTVLAETACAPSGEGRPAAIASWAKAEVTEPGLAWGLPSFREAVQAQQDGMLVVMRGVREYSLTRSLDPNRRKNMLVYATDPETIPNALTSSVDRDDESGWSVRCVGRSTD